MIMDPWFTEFSDSVNGLKFDDDDFITTFDHSENLANTFQFKDDLEFNDDDFIPTIDHSENLANTFKIKDDPGDLNFMELPVIPPDPSPSFVGSNSSGSSEVDSPDDGDFSGDVLKYINTILLEENMEQKPSMFHDPLALQATEKSLYDVIGKEYPVSPIQPPLYFNQNVESPDEYFFGGSSEQSTNINTSSGNSVDSQWMIGPLEYELSVQSNSFGYPFDMNMQTTSPWSSSDNSNGPMNSSMTSHLVPGIFTDSQSVLQFKMGVEEASKFLPSNDLLIIDGESYMFPSGTKEGTPEVVVKVEKDDGENSPNGSRGRKNHHREDSGLEDGRSSKFSAVYEEESELSEMFDKVLLCDVKAEPACCNADEEVTIEATKTTQRNGQPHGSKGGKSRTKKQGNKSEVDGGKSRTKKQGNKSEVVDLRTLLINCAQSVATEDRKTACEQIKKIRQHSSPTGDASQRLASVFASGLEARLAGTGSQLYGALASKRISAAEKLKAYQLYFSACPFKKISLYFANKMIADLAMNSSKKKLHIIDFGIQYGFQWPMLIQHLSTLPGGGPELRITGIELPQPGFRPAEFVEETGRRLAKYCERFNIQFHYHAIAQTWETIKIEDLNINDDEALAVNCLFRFKNLLDDSVVEDSPRDAVLKLIRMMNPDIFIHAVINGSYNSPFFATRFREALFHYSSQFDMFESTIPREDQHRRNFEQEFYGREVMNVVACEGLERVERPETYKQWQVRNTRAGFRILPLRQEFIKKFRGKVKAGYHKDFMIDEDGQWMLQVWKGRTFCASSCWVPA